MNNDPLIDKNLKGWTIRKPLNRSRDATGSVHSSGYIAENSDGQKAFVKVLHIGLEEHPEDPLFTVERQINAFRYERDIVRKCKNHGMSHVIRGIDDGDLVKENIAYLILELAGRDLREQVMAILDSRLDLAFRLRVLHQTSVGLSQLHWARIAHQDLKPSNVLVFPDKRVKVGDLGHAQNRDLPHPDASRNFGGDPAYAPPELLYGSVSADDWEESRLGADLYHLGSLAVFLFTGAGATPLLDKYLRPEHNWKEWKGSYRDVLPYIRQATETLLEERFINSSLLPEDNLDDFISLVRCLIEPDPARRGHPLNLAGRSGGKYGLQRFVSAFNLLATKAEWALRSGLIA